MRAGRAGPGVGGRPYPHSLLDGLDSTTGILALAAGGVAVLALLLGGSALLRLRKLRRAQRLVLGERGERDVVAHAVETTIRVDELHAALDDLTAALNGRMAAAEGRLAGTVSHTSVVRYDAFNETSGRQSSTVALLDDRGDGVLLSAILQRDQARVYAKPVRGGRSELDLSPEEEEAMARALEDGPG